VSVFDVLPAIDVRNGAVVRLRQGDYAQETRYPEDPLALAKRYAEAGAQWLHLVDLDAARHGGYTLATLLARIKAETPLRVQTGGGVRSMADVQSIVEAGADRVVVGSLAVRKPEDVARWLTSFGVDQITVALDARLVEGQWRLPTAGWTEQSDVVLDELIEFYARAGLRHLLCTDIERDGMLTGPNLDLYRHVAKLAPELQLQASGGMRGIEDIVASRESGCSGAVLGKALLEGRFGIGDAVREVRPC
jgi:phosphoribosylformimino-5-aminoimidazole carboxamide ribotide isomerase